MDKSVSGNHSSQAAAFKLTQVWPEIDARDSADLLAFWQAEGAIADEGEAKKRMQQVVFLARDDEGKVAGVCTATSMTPPRLAQPVYYWRAFVGAKWRHTRLIHTLLMDSFEFLEAWSRERDFPCVGVLLELENARFGQTLRTATWGKLKFIYIGKSARGLDVRLRYFKGARLK